MTEDEAVQRMQEIVAGDPLSRDEEAEHCLGDALVAAALREAGWNKLADAFDKAREDWWYA